ncbi:hypothetical protein PHYSODRAFT_301873 [Phytophthora sojae]|uniref:Uncharacterized protein n=1 Tax=Phytophthora sojae (strain P6497) TaxID=1094619 RepID=G4ZLX1_PHYSP|nr:hypothetical protein PHYSODRAFT_301873 [Phytophthora sojae]EGZ15306.1 hypothetical protein PHYSODRAFT_301873 [Phytophthora sojae]|eukprot:XP_009529055.1 hypothetical protein PHYSODRAFT_301873 [Phytophthora sojae]
MLRLPSSKQAAIAPTSGATATDMFAAKPARKSLSPSRDAVTLELRPGMFRLAWVLVVAAHMLCGMYLLIFAATYYYLTDPIMGYYVHLWAPTTGNQNYGLYALVFACIYLLHLSRMPKLVYRSIRECQLVFKRRKRLTMVHVKVTGSKRLITRRATGLFSPIKRTWRALFSREGLFGVENQHFLTVYVFREFLELSSQTYQAYQYSRFLPRVWLNTLLVAMLLINCWSTLAVQHFLGSKPALERVVAISADAAISIAMCVIVPCMLVAPYANAMDTMFITSVKANRVVKVVIGLWGTVIMVFHLRAVIQSHLTFIEGCRAFTRPWFTGRSSCVSLVINCHARGIESPDDGFLHAIDETALATLTFTHCPGLNIPPAIQRFSNLMVFHIYNSTITEWSGDANSISATAHPRLFVTAVARPHFPLGFPAGLLQPLPDSLLSIQFCVTDVTSLPDDLPARWHPMAVVAFEYGELTEIPASLLSLQVFTLSLKGNRIETIPQLMEMAPDLEVPELSLTENPLKELPDKLGAPTTFIDRLDLQGTNLTTLPAWTQTQVRKTNYMRGTPYCATVATELLPANVQCGPRSVLDLNLDFPLGFIDEIYAIDRK